LLGEELMKTNVIREEDSKGHHTTSYRQMFILKNGSKIIDTPGMRELGVMSVSDGMEKTFQDIFDLEKKCKFKNCTHTSEPGCAIVRALENGILEEKRWRNFIKIQRESKHQERKEGLKKVREAKVSGKKQKKYVRNKNYKKQML
jgi:ribosome biogenesis GTPase